MQSFANILLEGFWEGPWFSNDDLQIFYLRVGAAEVELKLSYRNQRHPELQRPPRKKSPNYSTNCNHHGFVCVFYKWLIVALTLK